MPTNVFLLFNVSVSCPATPKSASLTSPLSDINTFAAKKKKFMKMRPTLPPKVYTKFLKIIFWPSSDSQLKILIFGHSCEKFSYNKLQYFIVQQLHMMPITIWSESHCYLSYVHNRYPALLKTSNGILKFLRFDWLTGNGI